MNSIVVASRSSIPKSGAPAHIYCRVSTGSQEQGMSIEAQEALIKALIARFGGKLRSVTIETGSAYKKLRVVETGSGRRVKKELVGAQKALVSLLETAARGSVIYFARADRLSRSVENLDYLLILAAQRDLTFVFGDGLTDQVTLIWKNGDEGATDELYRLVRLAEQESVNLSTRIRATQNYIRTQLSGRGQTPYFGGRVPTGKKVSTVDLNGKRVKILLDDPVAMAVDQARERSVDRVALEIQREVRETNPSLNARQELREIHDLLVARTGSRQKISQTAAILKQAARDATARALPRPPSPRRSSGSDELAREMGRMSLGSTVSSAGSFRSASSFPALSITGTPFRSPQSPADEPNFLIPATPMASEMDEDDDGFGEPSTAGESSTTPLPRSLPGSSKRAPTRSTRNSRKGRK